ncbi:hypothetical protein CDD81_5601 [Ophiocordyceps australis]|uniref:FHA domain-containing protein n=1 Tax=Ophiocordyceps australis TaxID=1399860 RepID=A0A2C5X6U4_9HYPO|nr:hypothetical protein CDD81_5601 [Ophiocordyceps australis]
MARFDQAYAMMATLASIAGAGAPVGMTPPPTVTPAQVTLPSYSAEDEFGALGHANGLRQPNADPSLESFARVEFADSVFQMTTYAVIIGRDQGALMQARRDERQAEEHRRRTQENALQGLPPPSPIHRERSKFSKSYVSEEGGMLGPESDSEDTGNARPSKRRKPSTTGSSQNDKDEALDKMIFNRQYVSHTPGAAAVDLRSLRPSPWHVPFIGIHSPGPNIASKTKAISREHLKIVYNQAQGVFEAIPLHKNGFFCQDVHYNTDKVVLKCGDRLQIKDIDFRFIINGVERGCTGAEELEEDDGAAANKAHTHGGKEMSFEFEGSHGNGAIQDTSDELSELEASPPELSDFEGLANGNDEDEDEEMDDAVEQKAKTGAEAGGKEHGQAVLEQAQRMPAGLPDAPMPYQARKRGPGRPPKNGFMSKREQRLLKKAQLEMEKMKVPQTPAEQPVKRKVGRPRKHPLPDQGGERPEKRRYKPRKPKGEEGAQGASDGERRAKDKKDRRARPKSPALDLKIEDYSEEQLQKPNKNYGTA